MGDSNLISGPRPHSFPAENRAKPSDRRRKETVAALAKIKGCDVLRFVAALALPVLLTLLETRPMGAESRLDWKCGKKKAVSIHESWQTTRT
jgi:hypothetical protein